MKLATVWEKHDLDALQSGVVVEGWKSIRYGRGKRLFEAEFTEGERIQCRELYKVFLKWYSGVGGTGVPQHHWMSVSKMQLAMRLCNFFGVTL
jgi:hypothetical protein